MMDTLVSTAWLADHLNDPDLVILDCSVRTVIDAEGNVTNHSGRHDYERAHVPGAGFADLTGDLCDTTSEIEFAVPSVAKFCEAMGALGVGDSSRVVLYDSFMSMWAARVWWMLRWVGFDNATILDGGLQAWIAEGRPVSTGSTVRPPHTLTAGPRPHLIAHEDEVRAAIQDERVRLIDTLPEPFYRGEESMYARPGHIPTAENICAMNLLDEAGRYRPTEELAAMHPGDKKARTITYCGGGIMAAATAFVLTRLGYQDVAVYTASIQEWAANPDNPMVLGAV